MKRHYMLLSLLVSVMIFCNHGYANNQPFKLQKNSLTETKMINQIFSRSDSISFATKEGQIEGLAITGKVIQAHPYSFVRILLEDENGKKHLVFESNKRYNDVDTLTLTEYCEETKNLMNVRPTKLLIFLRHASLELSNVCFKRASDLSVPLNDKEGMSVAARIREERSIQVQSVADKINQYNKAHGKLWIAGVTPLSLTDYETRQRILGFSDATDTEGIEYYIGGIIDIGDDGSLLQTQTRDNSLYISDFDWRNRHGRNWMTGPKDQGESGYCAAFAICGMLEARTNLYYNQLLNLDLSEQDIVYNYARAGYKPLGSIYTTGMVPSTALGLTRTYGVLDEASVAFIDSPLSVIPPRPVGNENIRILNQHSLSVSVSNTDAVKKLLIQNGPVISGIRHTDPNNMGGHAMTLVGYHVIHEGDTICQVKTIEEGGLFSPLIVPSGSGLIGKTYWVFKDNYGTELENRQDGYMYIYFKSYDCMRPIDYTTSSIISENYTDDDIVYEDLDGDGYYNWGIGPKPAHCPSWVPDIPDGDDSDYTKGPMDEYGFLSDIPSMISDSTIFIVQDTEWGNRKYVYHNVYVYGGKTLRITNDVNFYRGASLHLSSGSKLIIDGGSLTDVSITYVDTSGTSIQILNNGTLNYLDNQDFTVPLGVNLEINYGKIN